MRPYARSHREKRRRREAREGGALVVVGSPSAAQYPGKMCPSCGRDIRVGDIIVRWSDDKHRHLACVPGSAR